MAHRFITLWFRYLKTDWFCRRYPALRNSAFALMAPDHGRMIITATNALAEQQGVQTGMAVADARAIFPALQVFDDKPEIPGQILNALAEWSIRYTDIVGVDLPDGLSLDVTGCAHLWGGEIPYLADIQTRLKNLGYDTRVALSDTIGSAWAVSRYGASKTIIESGKQKEALIPLPPYALRLPPETVERLIKLGLRRIGDILRMPQSALQRRLGPEIIHRLNLALGQSTEIIHAVQPAEPYRERLPCLEPIVTATGIGIALQHLLEMICKRLQKENNGIRKAVFTGFRVDGKVEKVEIGTHRGSFSVTHLYKLFEIKLGTIEPALGIDVFMIEATKVEKLNPRQETLWQMAGGLQDAGISDLMDRISNRFGGPYLHRYVPAEHHWPERSFKPATSLNSRPETSWAMDRPRPLQMLAKPQSVEVTAPIPDYPPMGFRYQGNWHKIVKADGPERIEREWWIDEGLHRDYYAVEDEYGCRYWLFRSGHYREGKSPQWFIHGFFA